MMERLRQCDFVLFLSFGVERARWNNRKLLSE
jgi:hypothetical protein